MTRQEQEQREAHNRWNQYHVRSAYLIGAVVGSLGTTTAVIIRLLIDHDPSNTPPIACLATVLLTAFVAGYVTYGNRRYAP
jgi:hypothetical protein